MSLIEYIKVGVFLDLVKRLFKEKATNYEVATMNEHNITNETTHIFCLVEN